MWPTIRRIARRSAPWILMIVGIYWIAVPGGPPAEFPLGKTLPRLTVDVSDGSRLVLPDPRAAQPSNPRVLVLNFWATYCAPCRVEAPIFTSLHERSKDVRVIGLGIEGFPKAEMLRAALQLGMRYPMVTADGDLLRKLRVRAIPTTYVIATDGVITLSRVGAVTQSELEAAIASAKRRS
ncbi:MAG TPA: TlpA disulfide reductase family protein [Polyangiales bacterium]|jgi:thiol-disulfide isomerase/thioredoxin|nr:TlpA disulfide reductase family protein [Polyangiales bacterium]